MPEPARLIRVQVQIAFLVFCVLVVPDIFALKKFGGTDMDYPVRGVIPFTVRHEREGERHALMGEPPHLVYGIIQFHGCKDKQALSVKKDIENLDCITAVQEKLRSLALSGIRMQKYPFQFPSKGQVWPSS